MDMNWNFMSSSVDSNIALERCSFSLAACAVLVWKSEKTNKKAKKKKKTKTKKSKRAKKKKRKERENIKKVQGVSTRDTNNQMINNKTPAFSHKKYTGAFATRTTGTRT